MIISVEIISIFSIVLNSNSADGIFLSRIYFVRFYFVHAQKNPPVLQSHYEIFLRHITRWWSFTAEQAALADGHF